MPAPISIVIPTYNRMRLVCDAIDAALAFLSAYGPGEIVVVDDASTDGTVEVLAARYAGELAAGVIVIRNLPVNLGPCGAKNAGARAARFEWIIFADSDDQLIETAAEGVAATISSIDVAPAVFFRCVDAGTGTLVGSALDQVVFVSTRDLSRGWRWGECLPVIRHTAARRFPYPEPLRGFEGFSYLQMARHFGPILVSPIAARRYLQSGDGRVTAQSRRRSGCRRARGYLTSLTEFPIEHGVLYGARTLAAALYAAFDCSLHRLGFS